MHKNRQESQANTDPTSLKNTKYLMQTHKENKSRTFGNSISTKKDGIIRIACQNLGCLGILNTANDKQDSAIKWIVNNEIDIMAWQEVGIAFHKLPGYDKFHERIRDRRWKKVRTIQANNIHDDSDKFQWGGTALISVNEAAFRITEVTKDASGLGRWCSMVFEGKNAHKVRVFSSYNPCKSNHNQKLQTVYAQHKTYFLENGNQNCPLLQFRLDLQQELEKFQERNEYIVIMMDFNENLLRYGPLQQMLLDQGLIDPIRALHQRGTIPPPTSKTGSYPIDSIFVSPYLRHIIRGGWLSIDKGIGDHRPLFCDFDIKCFLGEDKFKIFKPQIRRLQCENPSIVKKFNRLLLQQLIQEQTHVKLAQLQWKLSEGKLTKNECETSLQKIDNSVTHAVIYAERKCRKLRSGEVPFSIERKKACKLIELWNNVIRKKKGWNISSTYIKWLTKNAKLQLIPCIYHWKIASKKDDWLVRDMHI